MEMNPEQQAMQEKLKNMSPEELQEFQKQQCIFCQIITGKVQAKKIYEDDKVVAILDINPANPGHVLLLPREHYMIMPQIPEDELGYIFMVAKEISHALLRSLGVEGTNIFVANGVAAGQRAQHFMIHIIPRMEGDNVTLDIPRNEVDDSQIEEVWQTLSTAVSKSTGIELPESESPVEPQTAPVQEPEEDEKEQEAQKEPEEEPDEPEEEHKEEQHKTIHDILSESPEKKEEPDEELHEDEPEDEKSSLDRISDLMIGK